MSLYAKRLERGKYILPSAMDGVITISSSQIACMLEAIDWHNPQATWRPTLAEYKIDIAYKLGIRCLLAMSLSMGTEAPAVIDGLRERLCRR